MALFKVSRLSRNLYFKLGPLDEIIELQSKPCRKKLTPCRKKFTSTDLPVNEKTGVTKTAGVLAKKIGWHNDFISEDQSASGDFNSSLAQ